MQTLIKCCFQTLKKHFMRVCILWVFYVLSFFLCNFERFYDCTDGSLKLSFVFFFSASQSAMMTTLKTFVSNTFLPGLAVESSGPQKTFSISGKKVSKYRVSFQTTRTRTRMKTWTRMRILYKKIMFLTLTFSKHIHYASRAKGDMKNNLT